MLRLNNERLPERFKLFIWFLMSFQAGYINVGGFLIFGSFVSHVTGTSSQIGMGIAGANYEQLLTFFTILISFIFGAALSGHYLARPIAEGTSPKYILITFLKALLFGLVLLISEIYFLDMSYNIKLLIILMLSLACGIQNSTCAIATNGFLKPTHMTGLSTDIGIHLTKIFGIKNQEEFKQEVHKNNLRIGILLSFIFGGAIASFIFSNNGHYGFLFPFLSSLCMLITSIISESEDHKRYVLFNKMAQSSVFGVFLTTLFIGIVTIFNS